MVSSRNTSTVTERARDATRGDRHSESREERPVGNGGVVRSPSRVLDVPVLPLTPENRPLFITKKISVCYYVICF